MTKVYPTIVGTLHTSINYLELIKQQSNGKTYEELGVKRIKRKSKMKQRLYRGGKK